MDLITLAIIGFVAIAGPTILAIVLYWRGNPDRRPSWRRAAENSRDAGSEHVPRPSWWQPWRSIGGAGSGGRSNSGGDSGSG
jgi:hypothetical protein